MPIYNPGKTRSIGSAVSALLLFYWSSLERDTQEYWRDTFKGLVMTSWWLIPAIGVAILVWGWWYWVARVLARLVRPAYMSGCNAVRYIVSQDSDRMTAEEKEKARYLDKFFGMMNQAWEDQLKKLLQAASDNSVQVRGRCSQTGVIDVIPLRLFKETHKFHLWRDSAGEHLDLCTPEQIANWSPDSFLGHGGCTDIEIGTIGLMASFSNSRIKRQVYRMIDARIGQAP